MSYVKCHLKFTERNCFKEEFIVEEKKKTKQTGKVSTSKQGKKGVSKNVRPELGVHEWG